MLRVAFKQFAWRKFWFNHTLTSWAASLPNEYCFTCQGALIRVRGSVSSDPGMPCLHLDEKRVTLSAVRVTTYKKQTTAYWFNDTPRTRAVLTNAGIKFTKLDKKLEKLSKLTTF
jgi:hypothetical protein